MAGLRGAPIRADLSATLFLGGADDHEGGGLTVAGEAAPPGGPGDLLLYDGGQRHAVAPVTRGARLVAAFWLESFVPEAEDRALLRDLDEACAPLRRRSDAAEATAELSDVYTRLLRRFAR